MMSYVFDGLLIVAAINTVISAAYYLKILRVMVLDAPPENVPVLRVGPGAAVLTSLLSVGVVIVGLAWNPLTRATNYSMASFTPTKPSGSIRTSDAKGITP